MEGHVRGTRHWFSDCVGVDERNGMSLPRCGSRAWVVGVKSGDRGAGRDCSMVEFVCALGPIPSLQLPHVLLLPYTAFMEAF